MSTVDIAAIAGKSWPYARAYLERSLGLGDRLDSKSDAYALGYLSRAVRMDLGKICSRGQACGNTCIPRKRQCSPDRQAATSGLAKEASVKARSRLIEDLKDERDKKRVERMAKRQPPNSPNKRITEFGQVWQKSSFSKAPLDMKRAIAAIDDPLDLDENAPKDRAYFMPGSKGIELDDYHPDTPTGQSTYRHEYGHYLDWELGKGSFTSASTSGRIFFGRDGQDLIIKKASSTNRYLKLLAENRDSPDVQSILGLSSAKRLDERGLAEVYANTLASKAIRRIQEQAENDKRDTFKAVLEYMDEVYKDKPDVYKEAYKRLKTEGFYSGADSLTGYKVWRMAQCNDVEILAELSDRIRGGNNVQDLVGSLTKNRVSQGHSDAYYAIDEARCFTEAFANLTDLHGSGDKLDRHLAEYLSPKGYAYFMRRLDYAATGKI